MFNLNSKAPEKDICALLIGGGSLAVRARIAPGGMRILAVSDQAAVTVKKNKAFADCKKYMLVLPPEAYSFGMVSVPKGVEAAQLSEALRWAFAKDTETEMLNSEMETLFVKGVDAGGILLKDGYWVFSLEAAKLRALLEPLARQKMSVDVVDVLALAQRNLCWAEFRESSPRPGAYASLVIGESFSSLGIVSHDGDLLFHKQLDWSGEGLDGSDDAKERLLLDLQRNLGFFERRLSSVAIVKGFVYGKSSVALAAFLKSGLGEMDWSAGAYPGVAWENGLSDAKKGGGLAWLVGSLWRWG